MQRTFLRQGILTTAGPHGRVAGASAPLAAILSGILLAFSFPHYGHAAVAWMALLPLLVALCGERAFRRGFGLGLVTGLVHFAGTIYWLTPVMVSYGGLPWPAAGGAHGLLVAYMALFPAFFGAAMVVVLRRSGPRGLFAAPAVWVTTELGRIHLFGGFPWELLGYSQAGVAPVAQTASLAGVLGVSALVVLVNAAAAYAVLTPPRRWLPVAAAAAVLAACVAFGTWRLRDASLLAAGTPLRVAALQGNVAQDEKWDPRRSETILAGYLEQTRRAAAAGATLIVWPEASTPFAFELDPRGERIRAAARETGAHLLIGSTLIEPAPDYRYYNTAFLVDPSGATAGVYRKQHLVPFGEYVPLSRSLFFVSPLVEGVAGFSAGSGPSTLPVAGRAVGTAICYEIIYPALVRGLVRAGSELLVTITNDAWYGRSAAPHQHFQQASMRAVEQGRYLVRAANTGISGVFDPYGRALSRTALFEPAVVVGEVRLHDGLTLYGRIGDAPAYGGVAVTALLLWAGRRRR
ncbi:MAG: apolipoprotein N-acyltransferase [Acidobacteria bacterium]|nr:apolipoprotein N-acyltransferase [Acidobacteriota bacterium]